MLQKYENVKKTQIYTVLMIVTLTYKVVLEWGFWYILKPVFENLNVYYFDFEIKKFGIGLICIILLFFFIKHEIKKPSTFFLELHYYIAIIPMTVIYSFGNLSTLFYLAVCISFGIACIVIILTKEVTIPQISVSTKFMVFGFILVTIIVYSGIIIQNGMFSFEALDIYSVYQIRETFVLNKYIGYMFPWQYMVINPFFIIREGERKRYVRAVFFILLQFVTYLYSAQKTILFIIPLTLGIYMVSRLKRFNMWVFSTLTLGVTGITLLSNCNETIYRLYDLFVRRVLLLPANLKFIYYDFFTDNVKIGLAGTLWGKFLNIEYPYKEGIGNVISEVYFNKPEMNSNTGFIAEGYYRFGYFGIVLVFILLAVLLWAIDSMAKQNGYSFAICISLFPIFLLNDGGIIDPIIFGNLTVLILLCLFYNKRGDTTRLRWKVSEDT